MFVCSTKCEQEECVVFTSPNDLSTLCANTIPLRDGRLGPLSSPFTLSRPVTEVEREMGVEAIRGVGCRGRIGVGQWLYCVYQSKKVHVPRRKSRPHILQMASLANEYALGMSARFAHIVA